MKAIKIWKNQKMLISWKKEKLRVYHQENHKMSGRIHLHRNIPNALRMMRTMKEQSKRKNKIKRVKISKVNLKVTKKTQITKN